MTQEFQDILYTKAEGVAWVTINRPQVLNAFRPLTIDEMLAAFEDAWHDDTIGVVVLSGAQGHFCTGGIRRFAVREATMMPAVCHGCMCESSTA